MSGGGRVVAVFDLDGTLTRRDTLFPYVWHYLARRPWRLARLLRVLPAACRYLFDGHDRGRLKAALLRHALGGESRVAIEAWNERYLPRVIARGLLNDAVHVLEAHTTGGDLLVLMSASVDLYVPALGRRLGFERVISTEVRWNGETLDGALASANRRGEEKARCFEALRAQHATARFVAYGNSGSDLAHLQLADRGVLVNGSRRARREARALGVNCVRWRGTWRARR